MYILCVYYFTSLVLFYLMANMWYWNKLISQPNHNRHQKTTSQIKNPALHVHNEINSKQSIKKNSITMSKCWNSKCLSCSILQECLCLCVFQDCVELFVDRKWLRPLDMICNKVFRVHVLTSIQIKCLHWLVRNNHSFALHILVYLDLCVG